jgi:stalled ribosome rescue protein Dom34
MADVVIWIDRENAKIYDVSGKEREKINLHERHTDHHTHQFDQFDQVRIGKSFFAEVITHLTGSERLLILGPGVARHHFWNFLAEQRPMVAKKVVGCETVDHPTDKQIAALATKYFRAA